jgi:hypothetical protein
MARDTADTDLLQAALIGYQQQAAEITAKIAEIENQLGATMPSAPPAQRRVLSAAARQRIAVAQKKRWAAARGEKAAEPMARAKKSRISAAGKKRIIEATKKRWAEYRRKRRRQANSTERSRA